MERFVVRRSWRAELLREPLRIDAERCLELLVFICRAGRLREPLRKAEERCVVERELKLLERCGRGFGARAICRELRLDERFIAGRDGRLDLARLMLLDLPGRLLRFILRWGRGWLARWELFMARPPLRLPA